MQCTLLHERVVSHNLKKVVFQFVSSFMWYNIIHYVMDVLVVWKASWDTNIRRRWYTLLWYNHFISKCILWCKSYYVNYLSLDFWEDPFKKHKLAIDIEYKIDENIPFWGNIAKKGQQFSGWWFHIPKTDFPVNYLSHATIQ